MKIRRYKPGRVNLVIYKLRNSTVLKIRWDIFFAQRQYINFIFNIGVDLPNLLARFIPSAPLPIINVN